ncbi:hypothetical protein J6590_084604 [Homalodisca vitripennis]|nr:hypothetical protein J6590_084604 [Homalodisca vitripennis]
MSYGVVNILLDNCSTLFSTFCIVTEELLRMILCRVMNQKITFYSCHGLRNSGYSAGQLQSTVLYILYRDLREESLQLFFKRPYIKWLKEGVTKSSIPTKITVDTS